MKPSQIFSLTSLAVLTVAGLVTTASTAAGMQEDPPPAGESYLVVNLDSAGEMNFIGFGDAIYMAFPAEPNHPPITAFIVDLETWEPVDVIVLEPGGEVTVPITRDVLVDTADIPNGLLTPITPLCSTDCFPGDTPVATPEGPRSISSLQAGDRVLTETGVATIERVHASHSRNLFDVELGDHSVRPTAGHEFLTERGWVRAEDLRVGDKVRTGHGPAAVTALDRPAADAPIQVYDLELRGARSFRVGEAEALVAARTASK